MFQKHLQFTRTQFEHYVELLRQQGLDEELGTGDGPERITLIQKVVLFLWYMANQNSVREIADKFNLSQGGAHKKQHVNWQKLAFSGQIL